MRILVSEADVMMGDLTFEQDRITVGSLTENSVCLPGKSVAERHVVLSRNSGGQWFVEPTDPRLPTTANNIDLRNRVPVQEGMTIGIEKFRLKVFMHWKVRHDKAAANDSIEQMALIRRHPLPPGTIIKSHHEEVTIASGWLDRIATIADELRQCPDLRTLMDYTLDMLIKVFRSGMVYMGTRSRPAGRFEYVEGRTGTGGVAELPKVGLHLIYRCVERSQRLCAVKVDNAPVVSAMAVPLISPAGNLGGLYLDSREANRNYKPRHLDLLSAIGAQVTRVLAGVLEGTIRQQEQASRNELGMIREVQARMEPVRALEWPHFHLAVHTRPGTQRCCDVFDVTRQPNGTAALLLARVRGEGISAALTVPEIRAAFRSAMLHGDMPHAVLKVLNLLVADRLEAPPTDAVCVLIDPQNGRVQCSAAGEIVPTVLHGGGESHRLVLEPNPHLGQSKKLDVSLHSGELSAGDILVLCSPGLRSATNPAGETLTEERVLDCLRECFAPTLSQTLEEAVHDLSPFLEDDSHPDDLTLVLASRGN